MNSHTLASVCKRVLQNEDATVKCLFNFLPTWVIRGLWRFQVPMGLS